MGTPEQCTSPTCLIYYIALYDKLVFILLLPDSFCNMIWPHVPAAERPPLSLCNISNLNFFLKNEESNLYIYSIYCERAASFFFFLISSHFEICDWEPRRNSGTRLSIDSRAFRSRRGFGCSRRSPYRPAVARLAYSRYRSRRTELIRQKRKRRR